jgi:hypothetical protein
VRFNGNYALNVGGALIADGTAAQPIRFGSNTGGAWNRIYFDDPGPDAVVDANYEYVSGSILRHVTVDKAAGGIVCNSATPYLSHITLTGGSLNCTPGTLTVSAQALPSTVLVMDSSIAGGLTVNSSAYIWRNTVTGGGVSVSGRASVLTNTVSGGINVGGGSTVQNNAADGGISLSGSGLVLDNTLSGGLTVGSTATVQGNTISQGGISAGGVAIVLSNTLTGGGISVGDQSQVRGNNVQNAAGWGVSGSGNTTIVANRLVGNANGINVSGGLVQGNLIANSGGVGLQVGSVTVVSNTLTGNGGSAIKIASGAPVKITGNNLEGNKGQYDIENLVSKANLMTLLAQRNWWGTVSGSAIGKRIYDFNDGDYTLGTVLYSPVRTSPSPDAPAYVRAVTLVPESPVGIQTVIFDVEFSRALDPDQTPTLRFHREAWQTYNISNSGLASNWIRGIAADGMGNKWFGTAYNGVSVLGSDGTWQTYNSANSGLKNSQIDAIFIDKAENKWFGHGNSHGGASSLRIDGTWRTYDPTNSGLANDVVNVIATDEVGNVWFGLGWGVVSVLKVDGTWQSYAVGAYGDHISAIRIDRVNSKWFGTWGGGVVL